MKSRLSQILQISICLVALGLFLSFCQGRMNAIRTNERLTEVDVLENAPPLVAFTSVALGGFRGVLADLLWLRCVWEQDKGNYFEMVQLAEWILKLQPRNTDACAFLGWNMSYNISVTFTSFEDRWRWVKRGFELVRDEGLALNPGDPELFRQLGWIFQHKLGQDMDDANRYYKTEFAKEMIRLFAGYYGRWDDLLNAPVDEMKLRAALGPKANEFFQVLARHHFANFAAFEADFRDRAVIHPDVAKELQELEIMDTVEICLRYRWMSQKYLLDPVWLKRLNAKYGELDWRLPQAHAIYWAERGRAHWLAEKDSFKRLSCDRMIFQSLNQAFQGGRLIYLKDNIEFLEMTPNIKLVDALNKVYQEAWKEHGEETIGPAYGNFLIDAIVQLYKFGEKKKAEEYRKLASTYKRFGDRFSKLPLDEFVLKELSSSLEAASYAQAQSTVQSYLINSYYQSAFGEDEVAASYALLAKQLYDRYAKFVEGTEKRRGLPPFTQMARTSLELSKQMFAKPIADILEQKKPRDKNEVFIPSAEDIKAPEVN